LLKEDVQEDQENQSLRKEKHLAINLKTCNEKELWEYVAVYFKKKGIDTVHVGESVVFIYNKLKDSYRSLIFMKNLFILLILLSFNLQAKSTLKGLDAFNKQLGPGFTYMVIKEGKVIEQGASGFADLKKRKKLKIDSRFIIGSLSKQMTAMAVLLLEKEGKINREEFITKYLPNLPVYFSKIKVKHLIHHQGGVPSYDELCSTSKAPVTNKEILAFLATKSETLFSPGSEFQYSNAGYVVLAELVAQVSGMSFSEFMNKSIFNKLEMNQTELVSLEKEPKFQKEIHSYKAWPYFEENDTNSCNYKLGPGSVITNLRDYFKWLMAIENNQLIDAESTKLYFTPAKLDNGKPTQYAYGWMIGSYKGQTIIDHAGSWLSFNTYSARLPEKKLWIVFFSNYGGMDSYLWPMTEEILEKN
jgi:CubicO group peptidase (beta-lactamase class C family)